MFHKFSTNTQQSSFYNSKLFNPLRQRMITLIGTEDERFQHYQLHLERMGINLFSYLSPNQDDVFGFVIKGLDSSIDRTPEELDKLILKLVQAQDREWDKKHCTDDVKTKLNDLVAADWKYSFKGGDAWVVCADKKAAEDMVETLQQGNINATIETHKETKQSLVYVRGAYEQVKFNLANSMADRRDLI